MVTKIELTQTMTGKRLADVLVNGDLNLAEQEQFMDDFIQRLKQIAPKYLQTFNQKSYEALMTEDRSFLESTIDN